MKKKSVLLIILMIIIAVLLNCVAFLGFDVAGKSFKGVLNDPKHGIRKGIDLAGGSVITFEADKENPTEEEMDMVESVFHARLNGAGYTEARISRTNNQITVEIPVIGDGAADAQNTATVQTDPTVTGTATEETELAEGTEATEETEPAEGTEATEETEPAEEAEATEEAKLAEETEATGETETAEEVEPIEAAEAAEAAETNVEYATEADRAEALLGKAAKLTFRDADGNIVLDGATDIKTAEYEYGTTSNMGTAAPHVKLTLKSEAVSKFAEATRNASMRAGEGKNYISIYLDDLVISSPSVSEEINSEECVITGNFTPETAKMLANQIKSGQLPFSLKVITKETIDAELGSNALPSSMTAAAIGILLIMLFMIIIYRMSGFLASIALAIYVGIMALILGLLRVNLSLSGIAGVITSLGMAVDANVIIFERMKEELSNGKSIKSSVESGFNKAFSAILDSNITTLISCVVLYMSGIGTIRGFAITLGIGVIVSMFTAIVVTKFLLKQLVNFQFKNRKMFCA